MKNEKAQATPKDFLHDLRTLVAEAESIIAESASEAAGEVGDSLRSRIEGAQERLSEAYEGARQSVIAGARRTDKAIRTNPYQSLAIAAGAGLLVGILVGRRTK